MKPRIFFQSLFLRISLFALTVTLPNFTVVGIFDFLHMLSLAHILFLSQGKGPTLGKVLDP